MQVRTLDDVPASAFHVRLALVAGGGPFCDGYILGVIGVVLPLLVSDFHLSADATGLVGAASLLGVFIGGLTGGLASDRLGRKVLYTVNILMFTVFSAAQYFYKLYGFVALAISDRDCHRCGLSYCNGLCYGIYAPALAWSCSERTDYLLVAGLCVQLCDRVCASFMVPRKLATCDGVKFCPIACSSAMSGWYAGITALVDECWSGGRGPAYCQNFSEGRYGF